MIHRLKQGLKQSLLPCSMFENMGFRYLGPVDGHNLADLTNILRYARALDEPVLLHVKTVKGKGFLPAEENPDAFHGVGPFDPITGKPLSAGGENFSARFGEALVQLAQGDGRVCAITAAMTGGTGLEQFAAEFPDRFFDVGIAEGCAVSMAAGMAKEGAIPVFAVYSTFLQRAYDMLIHDVSLQKLHVVLGVDRAGLVGEDGETHQGLFDVAYLDSIPGMTVLAPASFAELERMLERAVRRMTGPVAVRYPRGGEGNYASCAGEKPVTLLCPGDHVTLVSYGVEINQALEAARLLEQEGVRTEVLKLNQITPLEPELVLRSVKKTGFLAVAEECAAPGCVGERLEAALQEAGISARCALLNCGAGVVPHGSVKQLRQMLSLDGPGIARRIREVLGDGKAAVGRGADPEGAD